MIFAKRHIFVVLAFILFSVLGFIFAPKPELVVSILIRLTAFHVAMHIVIKYKEWKVAFLAAMFLLMAARQFMTLMLWMGVIEQSPMTKTISEIPGFFVTLLSLVSIIYLGMLISGHHNVLELKDSNIKTLKSLLPICAKCKKIRDDDGYWNELESYIESHTDSEFSHGMCEECTEKLYGGQPWYEKAKLKRKQKKTFLNLNPINHVHFLKYSKICAA